MRLLSRIELFEFNCTVYWKLIYWVCLLYIVNNTDTNYFLQLLRLLKNTQSNLLHGKIFYIFISNIETRGSRLYAVVKVYSTHTLILKNRYKWRTSRRKVNQINASKVNIKIMFASQTLYVFHKNNGFSFVTKWGLEKNDPRKQEYFIWNENNYFAEVI